MTTAMPAPKFSPLDLIRPLLERLPWGDLASSGWQFVRDLWPKQPSAGLYEVLSYESTLELLDTKGKRARFNKQERVRYLQHSIIAYQDQAWGDGEILLDYRCTPGNLVDRYRPGQKTLLLISLREIKNRGDEDVLHITWRIRGGFLRRREQWETEVNHQTSEMELKIIFPEKRPPQEVWLVEYSAGRKRGCRPTTCSSWPTADGRCAGS